MDEKRTHIRINRLHLIHYECRDPQHQITQQGIGRTLDISESGLQLELSADFELDQQVILTLGVGEDLLELEGRVVRQEAAQGDSAHYGIQLYGIKGGNRDRLTKYIQQALIAPTDRRKQARFDMRYLMGYEFHDDEGEVNRSGMGRTLNVSIDGIVFEAFHPMEIGQAVTLLLALDNNALAELRGEVVHSQNVGANRYRVGIKFTAVAASVHRMLQYLISKKSRGGLEGT